MYIYEAWEKPAVWEQHCYDSVLAGKAVSGEDYRLAGRVHEPAAAGDSQGDRDGGPRHACGVLCICLQ